MLKSSLPDDVKVNITIDDIRLRSKLSIFETIGSHKKSFFFYTVLGFTQYQMGPLSDIEGFVQLIPGTYKGDEPLNMTGVEIKVQLKSDCIKGSIVNGVR